MNRQRGAKLLRVGDQGEVFVTAFEVDKQENAFRFWGQFDNESVEMLETLMQEAQVHAENSSHPPLGSLSQGDVCLAKFMEDGQWYRARVESVTGNDVIAYFVDFGNTEIIPRVMVRTVDRIRKVHELPPQATNCKLANVEPILDNAALKGGTHDYLRKQLEYQTFSAEVIARIGGNLEVKLCDVGSRKDIAHQIIQDGFGRAATGEASPSKNKGFKVMGLDVGSRERVFVSNVNTPNQFWIQQESLTKDLDELMNDMLAHYTNGARGAKRRKFSRGDSCVTTFSDDGSYYRGLITSTMGSDNYEVFFVDYGNSDIKTGEDMREITSSFLHLPAVAIESCLSDVDPDSCNSDEAAARFEELVVEKTICCKVTKKIGDKCSLLMIDPTGGENADIASVLVKEGLAGRPTQMSSLSKTSPPQGHSARNVPGGQSPARELDFNMPKFKKPQIRVGDQLAVQLTSVTSGAEFSCHLVKDADKFDALMESLNQAYASSSPGDHGVGQVAGGLPCCVQFSEDNSWYRAVVKYVRGQDIEVQYVDYGNSETVTAAQLKSLKPQFFSLPIQSIACTLDGVPHSSAAKSQEVKDFLDSTVTELDLTARIVSEQKGMYSIQLTDPSSGDGINNMVGNMLKESSPRVQSPREEMLKEYKSVSLKEGDRLKVFVGHVDEQAKVFVQKDSTVGELEALMEHMRQHFENFGSSIPNLSIGMSCGAQYSADEAWYRAKVTGIRRNGNVEVTFVDYGNSEMVNSSQIKSLTPDMLQLPAQAIPCVLEGLPAGQQTGEEVVKLQEFIESECTLEVKSKDRMSGVFSVKLTGTDGKCINDQFKKSPQPRKQMQNVKSPPRSDGSGFGARSQPQRNDNRSDAGFKAKSPPPNDRFSQNDRFGQNNRQQRDKGGRFNNDGSGDATEIGRLSKPSSDRALVSSNISDRSNRSGGRTTRSDDSPGKGASRSNPVTSPTSRQPVVPVQFKEVSFPSRGKIEVYISHINSPGEFWCQTAASSPQLHRLMSELHARYSSLSGRDKCLKNTTVGTPCVAQFSEDKCWYRGVVVNKNMKMLEVMFVDYGNCENVSLSHVKEIIPDLVKLPVLAVKCTLQGNQEWHSAQKEAMETESNRSFQCDVKKSDCGVYEVELEWAGKKMSQVLSKIKPPSAPAAPSRVIPQTTTPASLPQESKNDAAPKTTPPTLHIHSEIESLQVDEMEDVVISYFEGPARFWCQLAKKNAELDVVMDGLTSAEGSAKINSSSIKEGLICCAKYAEDGGWYRARITKVIPNAPEVEFIDYGNYSTVPLQDLRVISPTMTSLPAQAMQCNLSGLTRAQAISTQAVDKFTELTSDKQLVAKIIKKEPTVVTVTLADTSTEEDVDITEEIRKVVTDVKEPDTYPLPAVSAAPETVYVTNVDANSGKIYLQLASSTDQLDTVTSTLQSTYESCSAEEHQLVGPIVSQACCTKFSEDCLWYRGIITATTLTSATVRFIDYGNSEVKPLSDLKQPTEELLKVPHIALECYIAGAPFVPWSQEVADQFLNMTAEKELSCTFQVTTSPFSVSLKDDAVDVNAEVNKLIEGTTAGVPKQPTEYPAPVVTAGIQAGYVVNIDAATSTVYLQLASATEQLDSIATMLETAYGSAGGQQIEQPCVKQACCTKFSEDGQWYRGTITAASSSTAHVFFVDYGNSEEKDISELKVPTPEFLQIPQIALACHLSGVPQSPWQQDAVDFLLNTTAEKELTCSFTSSTSPYTVSLKDDAVNINAEMVKLIGSTEKSCTAEQPQSYPSPQVTSGVHAGYVVNVDAITGKVYIQLASVTDQLDGVTASLEAKYGSLSDGTHQLSQPDVGQACCTKFTEDEQWYRGIVTTTTSTTAKVLFIDYGNSEEKVFADLKAPTPELLKVPQLAVECLLEDVSELPWQPDAVDHFMTITAEKELACSFDATRKPYMVKVKDEDTDINAEMIKLIGEKPKSESQEIEAAKTGYKSLIPGLTELKRSEIYITATTSLSEFWIQPLAGEEALAVLMDELNTYAENPSTPALLSPTVGAPCVAKYSSDEGWYRGIVTSIDKDVATVRFVDYGNCDSIAFGDLKTISPDLMKLEAQAVCGGLAGVGPVDGGEWNAEAAEFFETAVADKLLLMEVVHSTDDLLEVKLMDMGMNVGEKLVAEGLAVTTTERVRQFPSVASEPEDPLEQASKSLVEDILAASLKDLRMESGSGGTDLVEADMNGTELEVDPVENGVEDAALSPRQKETKDIAHCVLDRLVAEVALNLSATEIKKDPKLDKQEDQYPAADEEKTTIGEGETLAESQAEGQAEVQAEGTNGEADRQNAEEDAQIEKTSAEEGSPVDAPTQVVESDNVFQEEVESVQPIEEDATEDQAVTEVTNTEEASVIPENDAVESDAVTSETQEEEEEAELVEASQTSQSDEECVADTVAAEADQHKADVVDGAADILKVKDEEGEEEEDEEEEEEEMGFSDALQEIEKDTANTGEQNLQPEADQMNSVLSNEDRNAREDGEVADKDDAAMDGDDQSGDVTALPEDDITPVAGAGGDAVGTEKLADESQGDLRIEFAEMKLDDSREGDDRVESESGVKVGENGEGGIDDGKDTSIPDVGEGEDGEVGHGALIIDESGDAPAGDGSETDAMATEMMKDAEADGNESFQTARGDISDIVSPDSSLYVNLSNASFNSGDLDSTLECDKTLDLSGSIESGTGSGKGGGDMVGDGVGGGGDAPVLSPPRCDSGIMDDKDIVGDGVEVSKPVAVTKSGATDAPVDDEGDKAKTVVNGTD